MSTPHEITGRRGDVSVRPIPGGWAWHCRTCPGAAGLQSPFTDADVEVQPGTTIWMTGEQRALSAGRMHADAVCAARRRRLQ
ncbi:MAG: hypothetical protein K0S78_4473 [Thermomicrobiales bacterium]|jgi:hypothetical protein|nr:hypothetical protein [Thermomicrobiales bacterium]